VISVSTTHKKVMQILPQPGHFADLWESREATDRFFSGTPSQRRGVSVEIVAASQFIDSNQSFPKSLSITPIHFPPTKHSPDRDLFHRAMIRCT
jgi:hypothetical protein